MSDIFGPSRPRPEPSGGGVDRRRRVLVPTLITLAVLLFVGSIFTSVWTDRLWFDSVDYPDVFRTVLLTRVGLFLVLGLAFGLFVIANIYLAWRFRPEAVPMRRDDPAFRYRQALSPILRPVLIILGLVLTAFAGSVAASHWDTFQMWSNSTAFGAKDPHFGKDIGFYVFDYPWMRFLTSFSFTMVVISVIAVVFISYVFGGIRLAGRGPRFSRAAQVHLSVLLGLGVLLRAFSYYLDRFGLAVGSSSLFDGIGYTDANARIPARNILIGVAIVCALLLFAAAIIRSWVLPAIGLGLLLLTSILIGGIWPFVMQSFQVKPSEPDKEGPYITRNIEATREAYDVADDEAGELHRQDHAHAGRAHPVRGVAGQHAPARPDAHRRRRSSSSSRCAATTPCPRPSTSTATRSARRAAAGHHHRGARAQPGGSAGVAAQLGERPHRLHPRLRRHRGARQPARRAG